MSETQWAGPIPSEKVRGHHRDRLAVVYVRQSTLQQLVRHQESTRLQYGLVDRALGLGWPRARVLVIDDDQGKSGTTAAGRPGFQRLVAEVGLNHVGLVLGVEMSRLARSCRDWHQLLEICGLFGTLIGDLDGIYDPTDYNDRLLLGLKGTLSEAELHVLKQRMMAGKRAKAERGELGMTVPMGYVRRPSGEVILDPDEQARATIAYWANVPRSVWEYGVGGYQVIKKWLCYREKTVLGRDLRLEEALYVTDLIRRLAALAALQPALDANYAAAHQSRFRA